MRASRPKMKTGCLMHGSKRIDRMATWRERGQATAEYAIAGALCVALIACVVAFKGGVADAASGASTGIALMFSNLHGQQVPDSEPDIDSDAAAAKTSYAIYSDTDGSLRLYNRAEVPAVGDTFENRKVTKLWLASETYNNSSNPTIPWSGKDNGSTSILTAAVVDKGIKVATMKDLFANCTNLKTADISNLDASSATSADTTFFQCSSLTNIDFGDINLSSITSMIGMFYECSSLTSLDVSSFDTSSVTNMSYMFSSCSSLTSLDLSNFDTSSCVNMGAMFKECSNMLWLNISNFDTSNVTKMSSMFNGMTDLWRIDIGSKLKWVGTDGYLPTPSSGKWSRDYHYGGTPEWIASQSQSATGLFSGAYFTDAKYAGRYLDGDVSGSPWE